MPVPPPARTQPLHHTLKTKPNSTASLDWWADPHAHETAAATAATTAEDPSSISSSSSVAYKVAACAKSLQNAHARHQQLPSAAFAAKAALLGAGAAADATHVAGTNGPAFLVVTTGGGRGAEERERAATTLPRVVEATLRIHGAGAKDTTKEEEGRAQQHHHHHHQGLRGGLQAGGMLLQQQGGKGDELALYAPTPECAAASQSVSHLYAHGRVPHCTSRRYV